MYAQRILARSGVFGSRVSIANSHDSLDLCIYMHAAGSLMSDDIVPGLSAVIERNISMLNVPELWPAAATSVEIQFFLAVLKQAKCLARLGTLASPARG